MEEDLERELARNEAANRMAKEREEQALAARKRYLSAISFYKIRCFNFLEEFLKGLYRVIDKPTVATNYNCYIKPCLSN